MIEKVLKSRRERGIGNFFTVNHENPCTAAKCTPVIFRITPGSLTRWRRFIPCQDTTRCQAYGLYKLSIPEHICFWFFLLSNQSVYQTSGLTCFHIKCDTHMNTGFRFKFSQYGFRIVLINRGIDDYLIVTF